MTSPAFPPPPELPIEELLSRLLDGELRDEELLDLAGLVQSNPEFRQLYCDHIALHAAMRWRSCDPEQLALTDVFAADSAVVCEPSPRPLVSISWQSDSSLLSSGWPFAYLMATVIIALGVTVAAFLRVSQPSQFAGESQTSPMPTQALEQAVVGRITGMADCKLAGFATALGGSPVRPGSRFTLISGLMEITYDAGAKVVLQGPATYEVESPNGGFLAVGRLTARVEKGSRNKVQGSKSELSSLPSPLFSVRTPSAIVTDLGTEFGVEVTKEGMTTSHVFRGSVEFRVVSCGGAKAPLPRVLRANESARTSPDAKTSGVQTIVVETSSVKAAEFVRRLPPIVIKTVDLVDVVAGGDGFTGRRNRGIDPTTGQPIAWAVSRLGHFPEGDGKYHRVAGMPLIDGVFVPDGRKGAVQIDSAGHTFADFINSTNLVGRYLWAGGEISKADRTSPPKVTTRLGDIDFASPGHGYLAMAANNGITFDLQAVRRANPGCKLIRFTASLGNAETESRDNGPSVLADVYVFVDGQVRLRRREINGYSGVFPVSVPIGEADRFLTLTSLDAGNGIAGDEILFGDPRLELQFQNSDSEASRKSISAGVTSP